MIQWSHLFCIVLNNYLASLFMVFSLLSLWFSKYTIRNVLHVAMQRHRYLLYFINLQTVWEQFTGARALFWSPFVWLSRFAGYDFWLWKLIFWLGPTNSETIFFFFLFIIYMIDIYTAIWWLYALFASLRNTRWWVCWKMTRQSTWHTCAPHENRKIANFAIRLFL